MARRSSKNLRDVHGVLLLNKPKGITSNQALQRAKRLFKARKAGHTGSLDPLATGVLPLCFGEATKVSSYLLDADKHYRTVARLGAVTTTADAEGEVLSRADVPVLDADMLEGILKRFRGAIKQVPPMYSALHHDGKRLYELAREGKTVERPARDVRISSLTLLDYTADTLTLDVSCSKGTYIRSLVEDIGEALGCGAHVEVLHRRGVDPFVDPRMYSLEELEASFEQGGFPVLDELLVAPDQALPGWGSVSLDQEQSALMRNGRALVWPGGSEQENVRIYDSHGDFMGLGIVRDGELRPKRLMAQP